MANDYVNSLGVGGTDVLLAPGTRNILIATALEGSAGTYTINLSGYYESATAKFVMTVYFPSGVPANAQLVVNDNAARPIKTQHGSTPAAITALAYPIVIDLFFDGTNYIAYNL